MSELNAEWEKESEKKRAEDWERAEWRWNAMEAETNCFQWDSVFYPKN